MKVLAKTLKENIALVVPGTMLCVDYHRYRVFENSPEMDRWESRGLIDRKYVNDKADDENFRSLLEKEGDKAVDMFVKQYSISSNSDSKKEEEINENTQETSVSKKEKVKSYRKAN